MTTPPAGSPDPLRVSATDMAFMKAALTSARTALAAGEFPVGCVIADGRQVVARGHRTGTAGGAANEIDHAELNALRCLGASVTACDRGALTLYCTLEPCLMCFSATLLGGIGRILYAYEDVMGGGTGCDRTGMAPLYRDARPTVIAGVLRSESLALFQRYFADPRNRYWSESLLSRYTLSQP